MKPFSCMPLFRALVLTAFFISGCSLLPHTPKSMKATETKQTVQRPTMSQAELQAAVIAFANRFVATIGQASAQFEKQLPTPEARLMASSRRVYSLMAASEIAAGPNPGSALLDMVVLTSLNRVTWDEYWRPQVFGAPAGIMVDAFTDLEKDIWTQASQVMTPGQREELREILQEWWIRHPNQHAVDYIRFSDFGDIGKKPNLKEIHEPGGLLAPIREATQAVDEVRMTSERAIFLLTKMQLIATFQVELSYRQLMFQPESRALVNNMESFSTTAREMKTLMAELPDHVANERRAMVGEVSSLLAQERKAFMTMFNSPETRALFSQVNATLEQLDRNTTHLNQGIAAADMVLEKGEKLGITFTKLVQTVDRLAGKFQADGGASSARPFDIKDYTEAMVQLEKSTDKLQHLFSSVAGPNASLALLNTLNTTAEKRVDHLFIRLVQLCLIAGLVVLCLILAHKFIGRHQAG